jgi:anti-sigma factor RsiW
MSDAVDTELTALLDGRLAAPERAELFRRLAADPSLQERFDALAAVRGPLDDIFAGMLAGAPVARIRAALPKRAPAPRRFARARLAAGFVIAALVGAALAALVTLNIGGEKDDWSQAVVEYMRLYTPETFAGLKPDAATEAAIVGAVTARLGVHVTPEKLNLPGLAFKTAFVLTYDGSPLGEFAFADAAGTPYLFCVLADSSAPQPLHQEKRGDYALATWGRDGKQFLVIGPSPKVIDDWAHTLTGGA